MHLFLSKKRFPLLNLFPAIDPPHFCFLGYFPRPPHFLFGEWGSAPTFEIKTKIGNFDRGIGFELAAD